MQIKTVLVFKSGHFLYPNQHVTVTFGSGKALRVLLLCTEKNMLIFMSTKQRQSIILCGFQNPELQDMNDSESSIKCVITLCFVQIIRTSDQL